MLSPLFPGLDEGWICLYQLYQGRGNGGDLVGGKRAIGEMTGRRNWGHGLQYKVPCGEITGAKGS